MPPPYMRAEQAWGGGGGAERKYNLVQPFQPFTSGCSLNTFNESLFSCHVDFDHWPCDKLFFLFPNHHQVKFRTTAQNGWIQMPGVGSSMESDLWSQSMKKKRISDWESHLVAPSSKTKKALQMSPFMMSQRGAGGGKAHGFALQFTVQPLGGNGRVPVLFLGVYKNGAHWHRTICFTNLRQ